MPARRQDSLPAPVQAGGLSLHTAWQLKERREHAHVSSQA